MKKIVIILIMLAVAISGYAQKIDTLRVNGLKPMTAANKKIYLKSDTVFFENYIILQDGFKFNDSSDLSNLISTGVISDTLSYYLLTTEIYDTLSSYTLTSYILANYLKNTTDTLTGDLTVTDTIFNKKTNIIIIPNQTDYVGTIALGDSTALQNISNVGTDAGDYNTHVGVGAGVSITNARKNTLGGYHAGFSLTEGWANTFIGYMAGATGQGEDTISGTGVEFYANTFMGESAGRNTTTGSYNTFVGTSSGLNNTVGIDNVFIGVHAGNNNISGARNVNIGRGAGYTNSTSSDNINIGYNAGTLSTASPNVFIGTSAGAFNLTGVRNFAMGYFAGNQNTSGSDNLFIGDRAGEVNLTGSNNIFLGSEAGSKSLTSGNVIIGGDAGKLLSNGQWNNLIGFEAGLSLTSGGLNTMNGYQVGRLSTSADYNTFIGAYAGGLNTTGDRNIYIGHAADGLSATGSYQLSIGNLIRGDLSAMTIAIDGSLSLRSGAAVTSIQTSITDNDTSLATAGGVVDYVGLRLNSDSITNASTVPGSNQTNALDTLLNSITALQLTGNNNEIVFNLNDNPVSHTKLLYDSSKYALTVGRRLGVTGSYSNALGQSLTVSGNSSFAAGNGCTVSGNNSASLGNACVSSGAQSFSAGSVSTASGITSVALGSSCIATGNYGIAIGSGCTATALNSHAFGKNNLASGERSVSIGRYNTASGLNAMAFGDSTKSIGRITTSMGFGTVAHDYGETVIGVFNTESAGNATTFDSTNSAFKIGGGIKTSKLDVFKVDFLGNTTIAGDLSYALRHVHLYVSDSSVTIDLTQDVYSQITNLTFDLFTVDECSNITCAGDSSTIITPGDYAYTMHITGDGAGTNDIYQYRLFKNGVAVPSSDKSKGVIAKADWMWYLEDLVAGDDLTLKVTNTVDSDDITITDAMIYIEKKHD